MLTKTEGLLGPMLTYRPPESAKDLLERYANGERYFENAMLRVAELSQADLRAADLSRADLRSARLIATNLDSANLGAANLSHANFSRANLHRARLNAVDLSGADLSGANLSGASLFSAGLIGTNLRAADLSGANLTRADLSKADLHGATLRGIKCDGARLGMTFLTNVDLSPLCDVSPEILYGEPSTVDHRSIVQAVRSPRLKEFLLRIGMPVIFTEYMIDCARAVSGKIFEIMQSTFLSYGAPDEAFARKLYEALYQNGVITFLFAEHAEPGERLHRAIHKGVNEHDRVVLVCSKDSLDRNGVLYEIEETLAREARDGGETYLIPVRLDDYVLAGWKPKHENIAQAIRNRVVADFEGAHEDNVKFNRELGKLLRVLRKSGSSPAIIDDHL